MIHMWWFKLNTKNPTLASPITLNVDPMWLGINAWDVWITTQLKNDASQFDSQAKQQR